MDFTQPEPVDRSVPKRGPAYRELVRVQKRIAWRMSKLTEWRSTWRWDYLEDQIEAYANDEFRLGELIETWWPELTEAVRTERAERGRIVDEREQSLAAEVKYYTGRDPRGSSGTLPQ